MATGGDYEHDDIMDQKMSLIDRSGPGPTIGMGDTTSMKRYMQITTLLLYQWREEAASPILSIERVM